MRIALLLPSLGAGGAERAMLNIARGLAARGLSVDMVLMRNRGSLQREVPPGVALVHLGVTTTTAARWSGWRSVADYVDRARPHAILATLPLANCAALLACLYARHRFRLVVRRASNYGLEVADARLGRRCLAVTERLLWRFADAVVVNSRDSADDLRRASPRVDDVLQVIPNPVVWPETRCRAAREPEHPWFRADQPPVVLAAGRLVPVKDHATLLRAFRETLRRRPMRLVILGEGPLRAQLSRLAAELGIAHAVDLPGFVSDPLPYMRAAAVFVMPSIREGCSNALVEAMSCGTQLVCTAHPSAGEVLRGGKVGRLTPVGNPGAMAAAILAALDDPIAPETIEAAAQRYSAEPSIDLYRAVVVGPLPGRRRSRVVLPLGRAVVHAASLAMRLCQRRADLAQRGQDRKEDYRPKGIRRTRRTSAPPD